MRKTKDTVSFYKSLKAAKSAGMLVVAYPCSLNRKEYIGAKTVKAVKGYIHAHCKGYYWMTRTDDKPLAVGNFWNDYESFIRVKGGLRW
jgi:hypothetical protein